MKDEVGNTGIQAVEDLLGAIEPVVRIVEGHHRDVIECGESFRCVRLELLRETSRSLGVIAEAFGACGPDTKEQYRNPKFSCDVRVIIQKLRMQNRVHVRVDLGDIDATTARMGDLGMRFDGNGIGNTIGKHLGCRVR